MDDKNIIIVNEKKLEDIKKRMMADGPEKLQVLADFDKTLTRSFVNGEKIVSFISVLRDEKYLTPDYPAKAFALFNKYHPLEMDLSLSYEEKKELMHEWWVKHYQLLIESGLSKEDLRKAARSKRLLLREGTDELFDILHAGKIPMIILSASGIGKEAISYYFKNQNKITENICIVSNEFIWDKNEKMVGYKEPIVHSYDKDYSLIKSLPFYEKVKNRKNIILLGDMVNDVKMIDDFAYDNLIKVGFLNETNDRMFEEFKKVFDVIILDEGPMDYVNSLLKEIM